jgi:hypothetical protein
MQLRDGSNIRLGQQQHNDNGRNNDKADDGRQVAEDHPTASEHVVRRGGSSEQSFDEVEPCRRVRSVWRR